MAVYQVHDISRNAEEVRAGSISNARTTVRISRSDVLRAYPHFAKLRNVFEKARPRPAIPLYPLYSHVLQSFYHHCLAYPDSSVEKLAAQADARVNRLLSVMKEGGM